MEDLKLATSIITRNEKFSDDTLKKGHTVNFDQETQPELEHTPVEEALHETATSKNDVGGKDVEDLMHSSDEYMNAIEDLMHKSSEITKSDQGMLPWLKSIYTSSRGFELGTFDPALISLVWRKQSVNWDDLALRYISDVIAIVHRFIRSLLQAICPDVRILKELTSVLMEELVTRYKKAIDQVKFILKVERAGTPMTLNHYFNENLEKW